MDIFSLLTLCGGLAFFLYGMTVMSKSLEKMAGGKLESLLKQMTSNRFKCLFLGVGITAVIQSSSAVTVMLVGLVNSGVMKLGQSIGVIMGSNIGTTVTAWILSLAGIESDALFLKLLKPTSFSPVMALIGIILIMAAKKQRRRDIGRLLVGFAILMYGMDMMSEAVEPLAEMPQFTSLMTAFSNPLLGVLFGAVVTAAIQSSSASVGILQAFALTGSVTFGAAIPIIMGQNIGTCISALLSAIGANRNARRVAVVHVSFNVIGTVVCLCLFYSGNLLFDFSGFMNSAVDAKGIAVCHSVFNIFTTCMLLPFTKQLETLAVKLVRSEEKEERIAFLDPVLLRTPGVAVNECVSLANQMGELARENVLLAMEQIDGYSEDREDVIVANEEKLDIYEDRLGNYLVEISQHGLSMDDIHTVSRLLHAIGDFERIGDHALNLQDSAREIYEKGLAFSEAAHGELNVIVSALKDIMERSMLCFTADDLQAAYRVEPLEETVDRLIEQVRMRHVLRLQNGECTFQLGFVLGDLLTNYERISDHCSNIALSVIEEKSDKTVDRHAYLNDLKVASAFNASLEEELARYSLPQA